MDDTATAQNDDFASRGDSGLISRLMQMGDLTAYRASQGLRTAWYGSLYALIRRRAGGFTRPGEPPFQPTRGEPDLKVMREAFAGLLEADRRNIAEGLYPAPKSLDLAGALKTVIQSPKLLREAGVVDQRRRARAGTEVRELPESERYPTYYRQNFHYQSDGWFSDEGAELYDGQVEILFTGAADAMRRMVLAEVARRLKGRDQRKVRLLDVAGGNGRFLASVMAAFPRLQASLLDLSPAYTAKARERLSAWPRTDVIEAAAENMPLDDQSEDLVTSIYLFHELPPKIRPMVFAEISRVLKPGGAFIMADSIQFGDNPPLDGLLEYFPEGFHEPYYKSYLEEDFGEMATSVGLRPVDEGTPHFLTKVRVFEKPLP